MKPEPQPCNKMIHAGYGFRYHCSYIKGGCPIHDRKRLVVKEPEAPLPPTKKTTPVPPAPTLFEAA